jgi:hypothetical protein
MLSLPLKSASDYLDIGERYLATSFPKERVKLLRQIEAAYRKAPYFSIAMPLIEQCLQYEEQNLFKFIFHSLLLIRDYLEISTKFIVSSEVKVEPHFKGQERVIAICTTLNANHYVNAIGGVGLYTKSTFALQGITLSFIKSKPLIYQQFSNTFVPNLSIIDVIMFNSSHTIQTYLEAYELI